MQGSKVVLRADEINPFLGWSLYVLVGVFAIALTPGAAVVLRPTAELMDFPISEDAYYSLAVARNLALGHGLTIDGEHWTNGFQPLFTLLCSVIYLLVPADDRVTPLRILTVVQWCMFVSSAVLFGSILSRAIPARTEVKHFVRLVGMICFLLSNFLIVQAFNGLETGFLFLVVLIALDRILRLTGSRSDYAGIGVLLGLCFLTRIDACFLVAGFCLANLAFGKGGPSQRLANSLIAGALAVLVSLPWLLYNELVFGSLMPTSGQAYSSLKISGGRLLFAVAQSSNALIPYFHYPEWIGRHDEAFIVLAITSLLFLAILTTGAVQLNKERRKAEPTNSGFDSASLLLATTLVLYCTFLTIYYGFVSTAIHFYPRYLTPYAFIGVSCIAILLGIIAARSKLAASVVAILLLIQTAQLHSVRSYMAKSGYFHEAVELVRRHVPPGVAVASKQSGTLGYFRDKVINLDGKVNRDVMAYLRFPESLPQYLADKGIDWHVDWDEGPLSVQLAQDHRWEKVDQIGRTILQHRKK